MFPLKCLILVEFDLGIAMSNFCNIFPSDNSTVLQFVLLLSSL